ncbi:MAG: AI-2E family transporter [Candidatus Doudnabacteria bacterium]
MSLMIDNHTKTILKVIGILLALAFLWVIRDIVMVVLLSLVLASAMEPMVEYLHHRKIPRFVSVLGAYVLVLGFIGLVATLLAPLVIEQGRLLSENLPDYAIQLEQKYPDLKFLLGGTDLQTIAKTFLSSDTGSAAVFNRTLGLFNGVVAALTVLVVSFYLVASDKGMKQFVGDLVPEHHQDRVLRLITKIQRKMGWWVVGQFILSLFIFGLTYIGLTIFGSRIRFGFGFDRWIARSCALYRTFFVGGSRSILCVNPKPTFGNRSYYSVHLDSKNRGLCNCSKSDAKDRGNFASSRTFGLTDWF